ncbi:hypothetical protein JTE90_028436 [Oedothorax gibbosus]|uniref:Uncharacterized protein n=1 Tax=Oedothorax gibbosus TaxID=931172 RepID=A0AAV6VH63_9ARAC|nr:hypothetical protein JTE90_028436 [Oedothorax gibbosus]
MLSHYYILAVAAPDDIPPPLLPYDKWPLGCRLATTKGGGRPLVMAECLLIGWIPGGRGYVPSVPLFLSGLDQMVDMGKNMGFC